MRERMVVATLVVAVLMAGCSLPELAAGGGQEPDSDGRAPATMTVEIAAVEDGDTFWFKNESGQRVGIRLIGVDTPEIRGKNYPQEYEGIPNTSAGRQWLYEWGHYIRTQTRERLVGETVRLEFDPSLPKRDYYGRLVAYVYLDGTLLNRQLLADGYARVYPMGFEKRPSFKRTAASAKDAERGIWSYPNGTIP